MEYKEKLKLAKEALDSGSYDKDTIEYIFPELKESEDEKWIPKEIAKYLKEKGGFRSCWLAWLEKQGEQKPTEFDDTNAKRMFIKALERVEEQNNKGYKLTDCDKNSWWEDFKAYTSCIVEQKPAAWSDEDERKINYLIALLQNSTMNDDTLRVMNEEVENWLKSLRPQNRWKPSDEQIDALESAVSLLQSTTLESLYNELKKLREE